MDSLVHLASGFQGQLCALRGGQTGAIPVEGKPREAGVGGRAA